MSETAKVETAEQIGAAASKNNGSRPRSWWKARTIVCGLVVLASIVLAIVESRRLWHSAGTKTFSTGEILAWCVFYLSLGAVFVYASRRQTRLELLVYVVTLLGEAVVPDLCKLLLGRVSLQSDPTSLEVQLHITTTFLSCLVLWVWASSLVYISMKEGKVHWGARLYLLFASYCGFFVALWCMIDSKGFVGVDAYQNRVYIPHIWPLLIAAPISYCRIVVTVATLFLPIARTNLVKNID